MAYLLIISFALIATGIYTCIQELRRCYED